MPPEILLLCALPPEIERLLRVSYRVQLPPTSDARAVRAVVTGGGEGANAALIESLPRLEIVAVNGVGVDAVDLACARAHGVSVTNTPGVLTEDVADLAIGLMIAAARRFPAAGRFVRAGRWGAATFPLATRVSGKRLGIFGLGRIGLAIAKRAEAFGMPIAYSQRNRVDVPYEYVPSLVELARAVDILVVAVAGGAGTRGLVNADTIDALGRDGILVNVARGSVIDENALERALTEGRLGAAALDVFAHEPNVPPALLAMDNVVLLPHVGSATVETRHAMGMLVLDNLAAHFAGRALLTPVV